ncbi:TonB-dependent receptor, partial [Salibacteraceae bacterium]|nr:TonB-dependent receptor [Salibacteraceae bacterium]
YQYRQLGLRYTYSYFDKRFISNDESSYMPAYQLSSLAGKYSVTLSSAFSLNFTASVSNLFDWQYQNMPWRPMPGRFYSLKIALKWKG